MFGQKDWAKVAAVIFVLFFGLGFFADGYVFGIFGVNAFHNIVHLLTGAIFAVVGFIPGTPTKAVNTGFGVVYILVGVIGFLGLLTFLNANAPDHWFHIVIGVISAGIGFRMK